MSDKNINSKKQSTSLPQSTFVVEMKHKYQKLQRVRCVDKECKIQGKAMYGREGIIDTLIPYTFKHPAYYVSFDGINKSTAMSEISLEAIGEQNDQSS